MFDTQLFASTELLLMGAVTGLVFGFLLQKGGVTRFNVIVGQFLLKDFTVLKVMLTAIVVGGIGIYAMQGTSLIEGLHVKGTYLLGNTLGGLIFGVGMVVLGYCPGTAVAALGTGSRDVIWGIFGMLFGAAAFAEVYPWIKVNILSIGDLGKVTFVTTTGLSPWLLLSILTVLAVGIFIALERNKKRV